jgi:hypothetical protein
MYLDIFLTILLFLSWGGECVAKDQKPEELKKKIANIQKVLNESGANLVVDGKYGPKTEAALKTTFAPLMRKAIVHAEGNYKNFGVLNGPNANPTEAYDTMSRSVDNTIDRFMQGKPNLNRPAYEDVPVVDYMQKTWAPIGAKNDPKGLNKNWAPNVRDSLQKQLTPQQYEALRRMRLAQLQSQMVNA